MSFFSAHTWFLTGPTMPVQGTRRPASVTWYKAIIHVNRVNALPVRTPAATSKLTPEFSTDR
jgi:hypothetical protein